MADQVKLDRNGNPVVATQAEREEILAETYAVVMNRQRATQAERDAILEAHEERKVTPPKDRKPVEKVRETDRAVHAMEMGRMLQEAIFRLSEARPDSDPQLFYPVQSIGMDDCLCFLIRDLTTSTNHWMLTNMAIGDGVWARLADEEDLVEINSGKWSW